MKIVLNLLKAGFLAFLPLLLKIHLVSGIGGVISLVLPPLSGILSGNAITLAGAVLYWLELIARVVPTAKDYTPLSFVIQLLQAILPNSAVGPNGEAGVHQPVSLFKRIFSVFGQHTPVQELDPSYSDPEPATPAVLPSAPVPNFLDPAQLQFLVSQLTALPAPAVATVPNVVLA